jgi:hypothetical protein
MAVGFLERSGRYFALSRGPRTFAIMHGASRGRDFNGHHAPHLIKEIGTAFCVVRC